MGKQQVILTVGAALAGALVTGAIFAFMKHPQPGTPVIVAATDPREVQKTCASGSPLCLAGIDRLQQQGAGQAEARFLLATYTVSRNLGSISIPERRAEAFYQTGAMPSQEYTSLAYVAAMKQDRELFDAAKYLLTARTPPGLGSQFAAWTAQDQAEQDEAAKREAQQEAADKAADAEAEKLQRNDPAWIRLKQAEQREAADRAQITSELRAKGVEQGSR